MFAQAFCRRRLAQSTKRPFRRTTRASRPTQGCQPHHALNVINEIKLRMRPTSLLVRKYERAL